jgi:hypothetical protein
MIKDKSSVEKMIIDKINSTNYTDMIGNLMLKKIINNPSKEDVVYNSLKALCAKENANTFVNDEIISLLIQRNDVRKVKLVSKIKGLKEEYKILLEKIIFKKKYILEDISFTKYILYKKKYLKLRENI